MKKKYKFKKRFFVILAILIIAIIALVVSIAMPKTPSTDANVVADETPEETPVIIPDTTINMSIIGDIMCHNTQYMDAYSESTKSYDFSYVFENIKEYTQNADITVGNLETTFAGQKRGYSSYPTFNTPEILGQNLKDIGLDVLCTANNHSLDKGYTGLESTITELDKIGIDHTGTYASEETSNTFLVKDVNGIKIGFLAYTYGTNGIPVPSGKEYCINLISDDKIVSDLAGLKALEPDVIAVFMHWGQEYVQKPTAEQERLANLLFENGTDIIIGSHPHVLEKMEKRTITLPDGSTKDGFVIFSLGNFISGQVKEYTKQSIILNLKITKHGEDSSITIDEATYTPIYMYKGTGSKKYRLLDIEKEMEAFNNGTSKINKTTYNTIQKELDHIYKIVGDEIVQTIPTEENNSN